MSYGFISAASARGLLINFLIADGNVHRCGTTDKPRSKNGAYVAYEDGGGWFQNHGDGLGIQTYRPEAREGRTEAERLEERKRIAEEQKRRERAREDAYVKAAVEAQRMFDAATPAMGHPYLEKKNVKSHGLRVNGSALLVPIRDVSGQWQSIQCIFPNGSKFFLTGGRTEGGMFVLMGSVDPEEIILIAEGYSTAATCFESTGYPTVVAFNCGNLCKVARALRHHHPRSKIVLCADDDWATQANPGMQKAMEAARAVGGVVAKPIVKNGSDFNDMASEVGIDEVRRVIMGGLQRGGASW